jgi:hypothetical protein
LERSGAAVVEADLVAHSGPSACGSFVQTLVLTDIATGWTECAPLIVREQTLLSTVLTELRKQLPFALVGLDTDNDTVFMNETLKAYCDAANIIFTRCRPYPKTDQGLQRAQARRKDKALASPVAVGDSKARAPRKKALRALCPATRSFAGLTAKSNLSGVSLSCATTCHRHIHRHFRQMDGKSRRFRAPSRECGDRGAYRRQMVS